MIYYAIINSQNNVTSFKIFRRSLSSCFAFSRYLIVLLVYLDTVSLTRPAIELAPAVTLPDCVNNNVVSKQYRQ